MLVDVRGEQLFARLRPKTNYPHQAVLNAESCMNHSALFQQKTKELVEN